LQLHAAFVSAPQPVQMRREIEIAFSVGARIRRPPPCARQSTWRRDHGFGVMARSGETPTSRLLPSWSRLGLMGRVICLAEIRRGSEGGGAPPTRINNTALAQVFEADQRRQAVFTLHESPSWEELGWLLNLPHKGAVLRHQLSCERRVNEGFSLVYSFYTSIEQQPLENA
jgi:hypothetical protein